jgi:hypothetical protein
MTKVLIAFAGLLIGAFLGSAILLLNPIVLMHGGPPGLKGAIQSFGWDASRGFRGLELEPSSLLGLANDDDEAGFRDAGIRYARAEIVLLTPEGGAPPALGVRLSAVARHNSLLQAELGIVSAWSIAWPGRGSVLLAGSENFWSPLRDGMWSAMRGRGFRPGASRYPLPPMPGLGAPVLVGGTGPYAAVEGSFREDFSPTEDPASGFVGLRQLDIAIE